MMSKDNYQELSLEELLQNYSYAADFFTAMLLPLQPINLTLKEYFNMLESELLEDLGMDRNELAERFELFMAHMQEVQKAAPFAVNNITIVGGRDKNGLAENITLNMKTGEIICIVGPTGSGKSRLLADIEWMAQGDTPTGRKILINGQIPPREWRFSLEHKLVAQLSQNMNFVVDMTAYEFVKMHAESRMSSSPELKARFIVEQANLLAGEEFFTDTPVTALSGGQSRALMIADTAFLSTSPIVLIDEIENAGIDRQRALKLLIKEEKIVLIATHDPILALMGHKRIVIKNGGINNIINGSIKEQANLSDLERIDRKMLGLRNMIRRGERIDFNVQSYFQE